MLAIAITIINTVIIIIIISIITMAHPHNHNVRKITVTCIKDNNRLRILLSRSRNCSNEGARSGTSWLGLRDRRTHVFRV